MMPAELDRLAAEHVLGLAEPDEDRRATALAAADPAFAVLVEAWRRRLGEIDRTAQPSIPPEALWRRIEAGLAAPLVRTGQPDSKRPWWPSQFVALWHDLAVWRAATAVGVAASMTLAALLFGAGPPLPVPVYVAVLQTDAMAPGAVVTTFADGHAELVPLRAIDVPPMRELQVWTLWDRARGPVSVGLIDRARTIVLSGDGLPRPVADQLFEITLEPKGGSPTGRPTGPILMKGTTSRAL